MPQSPTKHPAKKGPVMVNVYKCSELKAAIAKELRAHITDSKLRRKVETALGDGLAYGTGGGGGGVGVT